MLSEPYFSANFSKIFSPPPSPRHPRQRYPAAIRPTSSRSTIKHGSAKIAGVVRYGTLEVDKTKMKTTPWWAIFWRFVWWFYGSVGGIGPRANAWWLELTPSTKSVFCDAWLSRFEWLRIFLAESVCMLLGMLPNVSEQFRDLFF